MTVEHIRPKKDYPKKIFQWSNMLCSCHACNTQRSTRLYDSEKYLDPTKMNDIEKYFCYRLDGKIYANKELDENERKKAEYMIELYSLNRRGLVCKRREFLNNLMKYDEFYEDLKKLGESSQNIIFLSVFAYYRRCKEKHGE